MTKAKVKVPTLEISVTPGQKGDAVCVDYCITGPPDRPVYLIDGPSGYFIDWRLEPGVCAPLEARFPILYYYRARLGTPAGVAVTGFVVPDVVCLDTKGTSKGTFTVADSLPQVTADRNGGPVQGALALPRRLELQMIVGYSDQPLKVSHTDPQPERTVLAWQRALSSNFLTLRREHCWDVEPGKH